MPSELFSSVTTKSIYKNHKLVAHARLHERYLIVHAMVTECTYQRSIWCSSLIDQSARYHAACCCQYSFSIFSWCFLRSKNPEWITKFVKTEVQSLNLDRHKPINFIEKLRRIALQRWWEAEITSLQAAPNAGSSFKNAGANGNKNASKIKSRP